MLSTFPCISVRNDDYFEYENNVYAIILAAIINIYICKDTGHIWVSMISFKFRSKKKEILIQIHWKKFN